MANPSDWRIVAGEFAQVAAASGAYLSAQWISTDWNGAANQWRLGGADDAAVRQRFCFVAERAAVLLGQPSGKGSLAFWLDLLKAESPRYQGGGVITGRDSSGVESSDETGFILGVAGASAEHCYTLESQAMAALTVPPRDAGAPASVPPAVTAPPTTAALASDRRAVIDPLLRNAGWSVLDWAKHARVAHATAMDYLSGKTTPYASTRKKLADSLGIAVDQLP